VYGWVLEMKWPTLTSLPLFDRHIYPQQPGCNQGCQTAAKSGNPDYISYCAAPLETLPVRCCSDTAKAAPPGQNANRAYVRNNNGRCGNPNNGFALPGFPSAYAGTLPWDSSDPYVSGHVTAVGDGCMNASTYEEAAAACAADGARLCTQAEVESNCDYGAGCAGDSSHIWTSTNCTPAPMHVCNRRERVDGPDTCEYKNEWTWLSRPCQLQVQVNVDGYINLVHGGARDTSGRTPRQELERRDRDNPNFAVGSKNVFRVPWIGSAYPNPTNGCAGTGCQFTQNTCLCNTTLTTTPVFTDPTSVPSAAQVFAQLHIGAPPAHLFDAGTYTRHASSTPDVEVWTTSAGHFASMDTAFKIVINGKDLWLSNKASTVSAGNFTFRNPTMHMALGSPERVNAEQEVDALIDHIVHHPNTPLFISHKLILRFTTSNPSPRYLQAVAEAFRTGSYNGHGSGKYGDLGATISAVLLDREARSDLLEADPTHGSLREPILKVMHMMRSMEYTPVGDKEIDLHNLGSYIAQMPYRMPSVFNFYQPGECCPHSREARLAFLTQTSVTSTKLTYPRR
jgi:hypothetical protein